jgi:hypothetical protein
VHADAWPPFTAPRNRQTLVYPETYPYNECKPHRLSLSHFPARSWRLAVSPTRAGSDTGYKTWNHRTRVASFGPICQTFRSRLSRGEAARPPARASADALSSGHCPRLIPSPQLPPLFINLLHPLTIALFVLPRIPPPYLCHSFLAYHRRAPAW